MIVCGAGNNGGDGFVVARRLLTLGADPRVYLLVKAERLTGDALSNYRSFLGVGGVVVELEPNQLSVLGSAIESARAVVDAVFGTGLDRQVSGFFRYAIEFMNGARCPIFALDVPSGLDADTGAVLGVAVRAGTTITFAHAKLGLMTPSGLLHSGKLLHGRYRRARHRLGADRLQRRDRRSERRAERARHAQHHDAQGFGGARGGDRRLAR